MAGCPAEKAIQRTPLPRPTDEFYATLAAYLMYGHSEHVEDPHPNELLARLRETARPAGTFLVRHEFESRLCWWMLPRLKRGHPEAWNLLRARLRDTPHSMTFEAIGSKIMAAHA